MKRKQKTTIDTLVKNLSLNTNMNLVNKEKRKTNSIYNSFLKEDPFMRSPKHRVNSSKKVNQNNTYI